MTLAVTNPRVAICLNDLSCDEPPCGNYTAQRLATAFIFMERISRITYLQYI